MNQFKSIPGTFDVLPRGYTSGSDVIAPVSVWRHVEEAVRRVMVRYGAEEIRTPILEPTELIARGIGQSTDIVSKEMFAFERGSTNYVLRPEVTAPVMRAFLQHNLAQQGGTQRLFYIGPCFRAERPQKGRYRQFHQFGLEIIGSEDARSDAETITCALDVYLELGLREFTVRINSLGDRDSRPKYKQALLDYFLPLSDQLSEVSRNRLDTNPLRILDTKNERERELLKGAPILLDFIDDESRQHYDSVKEHLTEVGVSFVEDPFLVRGLDYYSRTTFEIESAVLGAQSALAGGGRYDMLSSEVGSKKIVPAVGFAAGIERLIMALNAAGKADVDSDCPDAFIVSVDNVAPGWIFSTAKSLRDSGLSICYDLQGRSMKAQMREANRQNARYVVIAGEEDITSGVVQLKDMSDGSQEEVSIELLSKTIGASQS